MLEKSFDLSKFANLTKDKIEKIAKESIIELNENVAMTTPVDTGRLRYNWYPAINRYITTTSKNTDKTGIKVKAKIRGVMTKFKLGDTVTMTNALPYALRIEYTGHSRIKAPKGMVRINLAKFSQIVDKNVRKYRWMRLE